MAERPIKKSELAQREASGEPRKEKTPKAGGGQGGRGKGRGKGRGDREERQPAVPAALMRGPRPQPKKEEPEPEPAVEATTDEVAAEDGEATPEVVPDLEATAPE